MKALLILLFAIISISAFSDTSIRFEGSISSEVDLSASVVYRATKKLPGCGHPAFSPPEGVYWENKVKVETFNLKRDSDGNYTLSFDLKNKKYGMCKWKLDYFTIRLANSNEPKDEYKDYWLGMHGSFHSLDDIKFLKCANDESGKLNCEHDFSNVNIHGNKYATWDLAKFDYNNHDDRLFQLDIIKE